VVLVAALDALKPSCWQWLLQGQMMTPSAGTSQGSMAAGTPGRLTSDLHAESHHWQIAGYCGTSRWLPEQRSFCMRCGAIKVQGSGFQGQRGNAET